ncbi:hypothetical protein K491DRAFT_722734 [Lophiostoma macrostomum CBS 122681]|uniref:Uncharacterized protein n=1 Tax=Lophiostoma macrostomum CBS 122681 TaxID=1314788 RepID=A0A6A6SPD2_9PLEO|nr:hypothetical protein K491DRAFT_722734 [Lophiostoma macrostomum CBS 122681]
MTNYPAPTYTRTDKFNGLPDSWIPLDIPPKGSIEPICKEIGLWLHRWNIWSDKTTIYQPTGEKLLVDPSNQSMTRPSRIYVDGNNKICRLTDAGCTDIWEFKITSEDKNAILELKDRADEVAERLRQLLNAFTEGNLEAFNRAEADFRIGKLMYRIEMEYDPRIRADRIREEERRGGL